MGYNCGSYSNGKNNDHAKHPKDRKKRETTISVTLWLFNIAMKDGP